MKKYQSSNTNFILVISSHLLIGLLGLVSFLFDSQYYFSESFLKYFSVFIFLWNFGTHFFLEKSFKNPSFLFYSTFLTFLLARVVIDLFGGENFADTMFFSNYRFESYVQKRLLINLIIALWSWHFGYLLAFKFNSSKSQFTSSNIIYRRGKYFFFTGLPFAFYSYVQQALDVIRNGYLIRFTGQETFNKSFLIILMEELYVLGFYMIIASKPKSRALGIYTTIYILGLLLEIGSGARGPVITKALVLFWLFIYLYDFKLNIRRISFLLISLVSISVYISAYRLGIVLDFELFVEYASDFFYNMGISIQVPGYAIQYRDLFTDYSFIDLFARTKDYFNVIVSSIGLDLFTLDVNIIPLHERINYIVDPIKASSGMGMGGSYVAEFFLVGREYTQLFFGIIFGFLFNRFCDILKNSTTGMILLLLALPSLIYTPRHSFFFFIQAGFISYLIILSFFLLHKRQSLVSNIISTKD